MLDVLSGPIFLGVCWIHVLIGQVALEEIGKFSGSGPNGTSSCLHQRRKSSDRWVPLNPNTDKSKSSQLVPSLLENYQLYPSYVELHA